MHIREFRHRLQAESPW